MRAEEGLAHALFHLSSLPRDCTPEQLCAEIERGGYGQLSLEFGSARRQLQAGASVREAFAGVGSRCKSAFVKRTMALLAASYETGADFSRTFAELAEDAFDQMALAREEAAQAALQKYTVLAASGVVVPFVLGSLLNVVQSLGDGLSLAAIGLEASAETAGAVAVGARLYLLAFSLLAAFFVSFSERRRERFFFYWGALAVCSQAAFAIAQALF